MNETSWHDRASAPFLQSSSCIGCICIDSARALVADAASILQLCGTSAHTFRTCASQTNTITSSCYCCCSDDPSNPCRGSPVSSKPALGDKRRILACRCTWHKNSASYYSQYPFSDNMICKEVYQTPFPTAILACSGLHHRHDEQALFCTSRIYPSFLSASV
jgi:hypothetical protein